MKMLWMILPFPKKFMIAIVRMNYEQGIASVRDCNNVSVWFERMLTIENLERLS